MLCKLCFAEDYIYIALYDKDKDRDKDRPRCSLPKLTSQQQDTHVTITKRSTVHLDNHILSKGDWRRLRLLGQPGSQLLSHVLHHVEPAIALSTTNSQTSIVKYPRGKAVSYLPFKSGWNKLFQPLLSLLLRQKLKHGFQSGFK